MQSRIGKAWELVSLRIRLTGLSVALIGLLLLVSSFGTVSLLRAYLQQNTDNLISSAATLLSQEDPRLIEPKILAKRLNLPRLPSDYVIAVLDPEGKTIYRIMARDSDEDDLPNLSILDLEGAAATSGLPFDLDQHGGLGEVTIDEHDSWRVVAKPFRNFAATVVVALPNSANLELLRQYRAIGGGFGFLLLAISGLTIWLTIAQALRPLREVERTAKLVASGDLSQRLIERPGKTEIARLNRSLNSMLDSLEDSVSSRNKTLNQMRRFVADASHELRTPLVSVRGYAELYRQGALKNKSDVQEAMGRIEAEANRMRISISLLTLGGEKLPADSSLSAEVNEGQIRQVLLNLIENAKRFSPDNSSIEITIGQKTDDEIILEVIDHGEGIPKQLRDKVFERFYRADNSRNRDTGGTGLGLSIVKEIVTLHKGRIEVRETPGGGATFRVKLPVHHNWV